MRGALTLYALVKAGASFQRCQKLVVYNNYAHVL